MSTRSTVFYDDEREDGGKLHIFTEMGDPDSPLMLEFTQGNFCVEFRLPDALAKIIRPDG